MKDVMINNVSIPFFIPVANTMDTFALIWTPSLGKPVHLSENVRVPNFVIAATLLIDCTKNYTVGTGKSNRSQTGWVRS
jgi:hypothetical protein